jgi:hypothetical protein
MDISQIGTAEDTAKITLYHPFTGEELRDDNDDPMWVEVYGVDSDHYRKIDRDITNKNLQRAQKNRNAAITAERLEVQGLERVVKCVKNWHIVLGGETPDCDEKNVRSVFEDYPWVREQVQEGMSDRANFLQSA